MSRAEAPLTESLGAPKLLIRVGRPMDWRRTHIAKDGTFGAEHGQEVETLCGRVGEWSKYQPRNPLGVCKQCTAVADAIDQGTDVSIGPEGATSDRQVCSVNKEG